MVSRISLFSTRWQICKNPFSEIKYVQNINIIRIYSIQKNNKLFMVKMCLHICFGWLCNVCVTIPISCFYIDSIDKTNDKYLYSIKEASIFISPKYMYTPLYGKTINSINHFIIGIFFSLHFISFHFISTAWVPAKNWIFILCNDDTFSIMLNDSSNSWTLHQQNVNKITKGFLHTTKIKKTRQTIDGDSGY